MFDLNDGVEREDEWDYLCDHADDGEGFEDDESDALDREPPLFVDAPARAA